MTNISALKPNRRLPTPPQPPVASRIPPALFGSQSLTGGVSRSRPIPCPQTSNAGPNLTPSRPPIRQELTSASRRPNPPPVLPIPLQTQTPPSPTPATPSSTSSLPSFTYEKDDVSPSTSVSTLPTPNATTPDTSPPIKAGELRSLPKQQQSALDLPKEDQHLSNTSKVLDWLATHASNPSLFHAAIPAGEEFNVTDIYGLGVVAGFALLTMAWTQLWGFFKGICRVCAVESTIGFIFLIVAGRMGLRVEERWILLFVVAGATTRALFFS
ncbi:hypothetical protein BT69DRAFT_1283235 [Atractiella rhizophila]|nr:hypothetical protein BT69DRAFT_1283235 [Atractiella rhizophila]